jgi:hypothetical protein
VNRDRMTAQPGIRAGALGIGGIGVGSGAPAP